VASRLGYESRSESVLRSLRAGSVSGSGPYGQWLVWASTRAESQCSGDYAMMERGCTPGMHKAGSAAAGGGGPARRRRIRDAPPSESALGCEHPARMLAWLRSEGLRLGRLLRRPVPNGKQGRWAEHADPPPGRLVTSYQAQPDGVVKLPSSGLSAQPWPRPRRTMAPRRR
jgi:hypothetical protein